MNKSEPNNIELGINLIHSYDNDSDFKYFILANWSYTYKQSFFSQILSLFSFCQEIILDLILFFMR